MKNGGIITAGLAACLLTAVTSFGEPADKPPAAKFVWGQLPPLPDRHGFAGGFAGVSHDALIFAGGANFPDAPPWDGGKKVWYDSIFVLAQPDG